MKNWLPNKFIAALLLFAWAPSQSAAQDIAVFRALKCLDATDLTCAVKIVERFTEEEVSTAPEKLALRMRTRFHQGQYTDAVSDLQKLEQLGVEVDGGGAFPLRETSMAAMGLKDYRNSDSSVLVRCDPGIDRILADEAIESLDQARAVLDPLFGGGPDHQVRMDIYPTANRFIAASGLPPEAVRTTGVIALSKWNRLLLTSPRATSRGYAWRDTAVHEYVHLVVSWRSADRVPVWLQEGLAKYLEAAWRGERQNYLSAHQQSLLAKAIRSDQFVPFEKFARSMAYLDSGDEAALAFAQVATMVGYFQTKAGDKGFSTLMDEIRNGTSSEEAVSTLSGHRDFESFKSGWRQYISELPLVQEQLAALPLNLDGEGGEFADDPVLSKRADLAKFLRLGDLLMDAKRYNAALIEYAKAEDPNEPPSPLLMARRVECYAALNQREKAIQLGLEATTLFPEVPRIRKALSVQLEAAERWQDAVEHLRVAHEINPYDLTTESSLVRLYDTLGNAAASARHRRYYRILSVGGARTESDQTAITHRLNQEPKMSTAIFDNFPERVRVLKNAIAQRIVGQETVIEDMLIALFSGGHCLFIGVPGLAKTLMVNTISDSLGLTFRRVQFTPDLMPSDITGSEILQQDPQSGSRKLQFVRGPIFTNLLLADEINRTPPKTQSALLEAMQERQVTALGTTYELAPPFQVFATQNPIEQEGTYPLPEAALDRFMFSVFVHYPSADEEMEIVRRTIRSRLPDVENVMSQAELLELQHLLTDLPISDEVVRYCTALARATRPEVTTHENVKQLLRYGAGTRASTYLAVGARTLAAMNGHETPSVDDVRRVAPSVLRHRVVRNFQAEASGITADDIISKLIREVK